VAFNEFAFGQFQELLDDLFRWSADVDQIFNCQDGSQRLDFVVADLFDQLLDAGFGSAEGFNMGQDVADFLLLFMVELVAAVEGVVDLFEVFAGAETEQGDQFVQVFGCIIFDVLLDSGDQFLQQSSDDFDFVAHLWEFEFAQHGGVLFHVEGFFGYIHIQGEDHVRVGLDLLAWFLDAVGDGCSFNQDQSLVDVGDDDVGFFAEWDESVFAFNSGAVDHELAGGSGNVVEGDGGGFQEFLIIVVFGFAGRARVGESEVVFDLGSFQAFFKVDRFRDIHNLATVRSGVGLFGDGVQGFAFAFQGFFHDAEEFFAFGRSVNGAQWFSVEGFFHVQALFLNVDLQQVQDTAFDVGRPWLIFTIEDDVFDQTTVVGEFDGQQKFFFVFVVDRHLFEHFEGNDFARVGQVAVHFANSNVVDFHQADLRVLEDESDHGLDPGAAVLFARTGDTSRHLTIVDVVEFATSLKLIVINVADVVDVVDIIHPAPFLNSCKGETQAENERQRELHCSLSI